MATGHDYHELEKTAYVHIERDGESEWFRIQALRSRHDRSYSMLIAVERELRELLDVLALRIPANSPLPDRIWVNYRTVLNVISDSADLAVGKIVRQLDDGKL